MVAVCVAAPTNGEGPRGTVGSGIVDMGKKRPLVIITRRLPDRVETRMCELFDTRLNIDDVAMTRAQLIEAVKTADVLVPTVTDRIDAEVVREAGRS